MKNKKKSINYYPAVRDKDDGLVNYSNLKDTRKTSLYRGEYTPITKFSPLPPMKRNLPSFFNKNISLTLQKCNIPPYVLVILGGFLITFGMIGVLKNTTVFTPMISLGGTRGGASFAATAIFILLGILCIFFNRKSTLGYLLLILGIGTTCLSIFFSLKMGFLPTSLLKAIFLFGSIFAGIGLICRYIYITRR